MTFLNHHLAQQVIRTAIQDRRQVLLESEAKEICLAYGIPTPEFLLVDNASQVAAAAEKVTYPVVLKIVSPDILHKTEAGGVLVNLKSKDEVESGYHTLVKNAKAYSEKARIRGVLVQHMVPKGIEVIVGALRDIQFGPTVMFGLGGLFAEALKDTSFRLAPLSVLDAQEMIHEIKAYPVLKGFRGQAPADEQAIIRILKAVSEIMLENHAIDQIDLNPVMVYTAGANVADVRMILRGI